MPPLANINIVLIEDNFVERNILKNLLGVIQIKQHNLNIFSSKKGLQGLNKVFDSKPDIFIIDSNLSDFTESQLIDYLNSHLKAFKEITSVPVIVLHENNYVIPSLAPDYVIFNKKDKKFLDKLIKFLEINIIQLEETRLKTIESRYPVQIIRPERLEGFRKKMLLLFSKKAIDHANDSEILEKTKVKNRGIIKAAKSVLSLIASAFASFNLVLFILLIFRSKIQENNPVQAKEDKRIFQRKIFPSFATVLSAILLAFSFLTFGLSTIGLNQGAKAATVTWDGGGDDGICGGVGLGKRWSCAANWSDDTVPVNGDHVIFNSTNEEAELDILNLNLGSLTITSGYTGSIYLAFGSGFSISGDYTQSGGTIDTDTTPFSIGGDFDLSGGTFLTDSSNINIGGDFTISGSPTYDQAQLISFNGTTSANIGCNNISIAATVAFTHSAGTKTIGSNCSINTGSNTSIPASITVNGTMSGTQILTLNGGTLTLGNGGIITGYGQWNGSGNLVFGTSNIDTVSDIETTGTITINGTIDMTDMNLLSVASFTLNSGTFTAPRDLIFDGDVAINGGTFVNGDTVVFADDVDTITCAVATTFSPTTIQGTNGKTIGSNCNLFFQSHLNISQDIILNGTISSTGSLNLNINSGTLTLNNGGLIDAFSQITTSTGTTVVFNGGDIQNLTSGTFTINGSVEVSANTNLGSIGGSSMTIGEDFTMNAGSYTFTAPGSLRFNRNVTLNGGTYSAGTVTRIADGTATIDCNIVVDFNLVQFLSLTGTKTIDGCDLDTTTVNISTPLILKGGSDITNSITFTTSSSVTIDGNASLASAIATINDLNINSGTFDTSGTELLRINNDLNLAGGTFIAPGDGLNKIEIGGDWNKTGGTYTHYNAAVEFTGGDQAINGSNTFYTFAKSNSGSQETLTFAAGSTQTIVNQLFFNSPGGPNSILLRSSTPGTRWNIDSQGTESITGTNVQDSNNLGSIAFNVNIEDFAGNVDSGNNIRWSFYYPDTENLGPTNLVNGSTVDSNTPTLTFDALDDDNEAKVKYNLQVSTTSDFSSPIINYTSAFIEGGEKTFTVGQAAGSGTYTTGSQGQTLENGDYYWRVKTIDEAALETDYVAANSGSKAFTVDFTGPTPTPTPSDTPTTTPTATATPTASPTSSPTPTVSIIGSITINNGATYTNTRSVNLSIVSAEATQMMISQNSAFTGASFETYTTTKTLELSEGDGIKTVYIKFKDSEGNISTEYSDSITLDMTPPEFQLTKIGDITTSTTTQKYTFNTFTPTFSGTGENDSIITITINGETHTSTYTVSGNVWMLSGIVLTEGIYPIILKSTDTAGNTKEISFEITIAPTLSPTPTAVTRTLIIKVKDKNNKPVEGATVRIDDLNQEKKTDVQGVATFTNIPIGKHKIITTYGDVREEVESEITEELSNLSVDVTLDSVINTDTGDLFSRLLKEIGVLGAISGSAVIGVLVVQLFNILAGIKFLFSEGLFIPFLGLLFKRGKHGKIVDDFSKETIALAVVKVFKDETLISKHVTGLFGKFYIELEAGEYKLEFYRKDYKPKSIILKLKEKSRVEKVVELSKEESKDLFASLQFKRFNVNPKVIILTAAFVMAFINSLLLTNTASIILFIISSIICILGISYKFGKKFFAQNFEIPS